MNFLVILHVLITLALISVILLQKGENGGLAPSSTQPIFTARGGANLLTRVTALLMALFMANCLLMVWVANREFKKEAAIIERAKQ